MSKLTDAQRDDILALNSQTDEEIDYSDIPSIREIPANATRGRFYRGPAIYLTDELHAYFSAVVARRSISMNELVNDVLRSEVAIVESLR